ncbi:MAG: hypothetical protein ABI167_00370 [Nitrosospira sp.]
MKNGVINLFMLAGISFTTLSVFAQEAPAKAPRVIDVPCIQNAIDARDGSLADMIGNWSSQVSNALEMRRDALKNSWSISDYEARRFAQRKAWSDYGRILRSANGEKIKTRGRVWRTFDNNRKQCEGAYSPEMKTGSTYDANL